MTSLNEAEIDPGSPADRCWLQHALARTDPAYASGARSQVRGRHVPIRGSVPLEGWFISAAGSDKIVIANHPRWFGRAVLPAHLDPWKSLFAAVGNDFEVGFLPDYQILHDAGYNVLAYDRGSRRRNLPTHEDG
jgi:hypothetical protein